jgi:hypothetical protein
MFRHCGLGFAIRRLSKAVEQRGTRNKAVTGEGSFTPDFFGHVPAFPEFELAGRETGVRVRITFEGERM